MFVAFLLGRVIVNTKRDSNYNSHLTFPALDIVTLLLTKFCSITPSSVEFNALLGLQSGKHWSHIALINCTNGIRLELVLLWELWHVPPAFYNLSELCTEIIFFLSETGIMIVWVGLWHHVTYTTQACLFRYKDFPVHLWPNAEEHIVYIQTKFHSNSTKYEL